MPEVRAATPDDVPQVLPMVAAIARLHESWDAAKYGYLSDPQEMYRSWLQARSRDPQSVFLVAEITSPRAREPSDSVAGHADPRIVAFLIGTIEREIPIYRIERFGFIHDLWVDPDYRHEGLGRQLTMRAVERFKELGVPQVRCDTAWANEPARKLFAACGFRASIVEMLLEL